MTFAVNNPGFDGEFVKRAFFIIFLSKFVMLLTFLLTQGVRHEQNIDLNYSQHITLMTILNKKRKF